VMSFQGAETETIRIVSAAYRPIGLRHHPDLCQPLPG